MADEEEDPTFEEENEEIGGGAEGGQGKRKRLFSKELRCMMYGFGDDQNPYTESVDILEDLVIEFITEMQVLLKSFKIITRKLLTGTLGWLSWLDDCLRLRS
ncbi:transcription initiation factor TFIID subunit 13 isoform X2 [Mustela putorius furo]|uniref:Transcription initiation factor TFIID subunit 13 n=1 Tax=Mustela putorius furo TaxID=9669 RepID=A0A8U0T8Q3_MUSPF|nr:transcription initiation factor TFIID subunit 13 isoform X2 [Mustela putorius furo]